MQKPDYSSFSIAFLGGGNMAEALIGGLCAAESARPTRVGVAEPQAQRREQLQEQFGCEIAASITELLGRHRYDVLMLAVKPQAFPEVLAELRAMRTELPPLLLSIAAGMTIEAIREGIGAPDHAVVRAMPNTPALVGGGISGLVAADGVTDAQREMAAGILGAVGEVCWVKSQVELDAVTAISGSGPAYYFLFTEALVDAGIALGLPPETTRQLAIGTALGAARLMRQSDDIADLRRRVTSPGGTTEQAVRVFEDGGLAELVRRATAAAATRAAELAATSAVHPSPDHESTSHQ